MDNLQSNISLAKYTTFKTGGEAKYFVSASNEAELVAALQYAKENNLPTLILGGGSNLLVGDEGFSGLVIHMAIEGLEIEETPDRAVVTAGAGMLFDDLVSSTVEKGWWGLENLSHIPGSVGATPVQNVGAYGVEVGDCIEKVRVYDKEEGRFLDLSKDECKFSYRNSIFKAPEGQRFVIVTVSFGLSKKPEPKLKYADLQERFSQAFAVTPLQIREAIIEIRAQKFPDWHKVGTAGSFFKNPIISKEHYKNLCEKYPDLPSYPVSDDEVKVPLGWVLDKILEVRGYSEGAVGCYKGQALVLVNTGGATTSDILHFAEKIVSRVYEATAIKIEYEVTVVG